jgi:hypothetical protein
LRGYNDEDLYIIKIKNCPYSGRSLNKISKEKPNPKNPTPNPTKTKASAMLK